MATAAASAPSTARAFLRRSICRASPASYATGFSRFFSSAAPPNCPSSPPSPPSDPQRPRARRSWNRRPRLCAAVATPPLGSRRLSSDVHDSNRPGLYSLPGLHTPHDFRRLAQDAVRRCDDLRDALRSGPPASLLRSDDPAAPSRWILRTLDDVSNVVCSVIDAAELCRSSHASPLWRDAAGHAFQHLSEYIAELNADETLYRALLTAVTDDRGAARWTPEEKRFASTLRREFERDGIHLPSAERDAVREGQSRVVKLESLFMENVTSRRKFFDVSQVEEVERIIPRHVLDMYVPSTASSSSSSSSPHRGPDESCTVHPSALGKDHTADRVTLSSDGHVCNTLLRYSSDPNLRREVFVQSNTAVPDNLDVLDALIDARHDVATKLGYPSYAHRFLSDKMVGTPERVEDFLRQVDEGCRGVYEREMAMILEAKRRVEGMDAAGGGQVEPWDVPFYTGLLKSQLQRQWQSEQDGGGQGGGSADAESSLAGYLTVPQTLEGMKTLVETLFGIDMVEVDRIPTGERWDLDEADLAAGAGTDMKNEARVRKFDFHHPEEGPLGTMYLDLHPREGKYVHAAHFTVRCGCSARANDDGGASSSSAAASSSSSHENRDQQLPIVALVCNLSPPSTPSSPAVLSHAEVETLLHEFGHALHSLLSRTTFQHLSGTRASLDFVETPSHLLEKFAWDPDFLALVGKHPVTGMPPPKGTVQRLVSSRDAFRALEVRQQVVYARFDQALFGAQAWRSGGTTTTDLFAQLHRDHGVPHSDGTHWHTRFGHLVTYGAGYYSYLYAQVFAADVWGKCFAGTAARRGGDALAGRRRAGTRLWRDMLVHGGSKDPNAMLIDVLGRDPRVDAFFEGMSP